MDSQKQLSRFTWIHARSFCTEFLEDIQEKAVFDEKYNKRKIEGRLRSRFFGLNGGQRAEFLFDMDRVTFLNMGEELSIRIHLELPRLIPNDEKYRCRENDSMELLINLQRIVTFIKTLHNEFHFLGKLKQDLGEFKAEREYVFRINDNDYIEICDTEKLILKEFVLVLARPIILLE